MWRLGLPALALDHRRSGRPRSRHIGARNTEYAPGAIAEPSWRPTPRPLAVVVEARAADLGGAVALEQLVVDGNVVEAAEGGRPAVDGAGRWRVAPEEGQGEALLGRALGGRGCRPRRGRACRGARATP